MSKSIISEGKTTHEAIENGLKELKVSKDKVDIKVLESENKRTIFCSMPCSFHHIQQMFVKYFLCAKHYAKSCGYKMSEVIAWGE